MISFRVIAALLNEATQDIEVVKEITDDNGTHLNLHCIPIEAFECRSAEYGIDDPDALVELVLHEPFIEPTEHLTMSVDEAQSLHTGKVVQLKATMAKSLPLLDMKAGIDDVASDKAMLTAAGIDQKYVDAVVDNPREVIKQHMLFDPEVIKAKSEFIAKQRVKVQKAAARTALRQEKGMPENRAQEFRERFLTERSKEGKKAEAPKTTSTTTTLYKGKKV